MYCQHCGTELPESAEFCSACGSARRPQTPEAPAGLYGFSPRINDPAFAKYIKNSNRWSAIFAAVLAVAAVVGFTIYGESSDEMGNPGALFIGLGIGGMFLIIALVQILRRKGSRTWDGTIVDKKIKKKVERQTYGDGDVYYNDYLEYSVVIRSDQGKQHVMKWKNDDTLYNYYKVGDRVRHHAGLNSCEKYDKTGDAFIPCSACGTLCDIGEDYCFRCKCPLLK